MGALGTPQAVRPVGSEGWTVMAFDPGTETGWCKLRHADDVLAMVRNNQGGVLGALREAGRQGLITVGTASVQGDVWGGRFGEVGLVTSLFTEVVVVDHFVIEDFILRRSEKSRSLLAPVRVGSMLEYVAMHLRRTVAWQAPSDISIYPDQMLKDAGLWLKGPDHRRDALRHMALYLSRQAKAAVDG